MNASLLGRIAPPGAPQSGGSPLFASSVRAGFPSPADDYSEGRISLDAHLVRHREATFFLRVEGDSMIGRAICDGDLLVVDRSVEPVAGSVVIAVLDGEFTVKEFWRDEAGRPVLKAANPAYPDILIEEGRELAVWGVVRWAIHEVKPCGV